MNVDPLWPSESPYLYVHGAPISLTDLYGMQGVIVPGPPLKIPRNTGQDCSDQRTICIFLDVNCLICLKGTYDRSYQWQHERRSRPPAMPESWYNAMRHCIASCLAKRKCGCDCAKLGDAREWSISPTVDNLCDLHNNKFGRFLGTLGGNCPDLCHQAFKEGNLCPKHL